MFSLSLSVTSVRLLFSQFVALVKRFLIVNGSSLSSPAELSIELSRPLKVNPTLTRLEQAKAFLKKILPEGSSESRKAPSPPQPSPAKPTASRTSTTMEGTLLKSQPTTGRAGVLAALAPFHRALVRTAQIVVVLEAEIAPTQPSLTLSVSGLTGSLTLRNGPKPAGEWIPSLC